MFASRQTRLTRHHRLQVDSHSKRKVNATFASVKLPVAVDSAI